MKMDLYDMSIEEMQEFAVYLGEKSYRGRQLFRWIYADGDEGTALPKAFRQKLEEKATHGRWRICDVRIDEKDGTRKFLLEVKDREEVRKENTNGDLETIESVFMKYRYGNTLCVSSQIGCRMGCGFCASALGGLVRDLTAGEMVAQIMLAEEAIGEKIDHIVVMGMGEPFDNYDNVARFLKIIHEPEGRRMSWRNMTVSTCGIIPGIARFAGDFPQVNLAISLHRATDEERSRLMPINRRYPMGELMLAAREYTDRTHRRVTFEYALIAGENDGDRDADRLVDLLKGMLCHVNLITLNEVDEIGLRGSDRVGADRFMKRLERGGIPVTLRRKLGTSIDGACGQLRLRKK